MIIVNEELFGDPFLTSPSTVILVTTNGEIIQKTRKGFQVPELIMGKGSALEVKKFFPSIAAQAAMKIMKDRIPFIDSIYRYGFLMLVAPSEYSCGYGIFQTKLNSWEYSALFLIKISVAGLVEYCKANPDIAVRMPFPGIGYGGLPRKLVEPILAPLAPYNVTVCVREE